MWRERARALLRAIGRACPVAASVIWLTIGLGTVHAQDMPAQISPTLSLQSHGRARPLDAWVEFCARVPSECEVRPDEPAVIKLTPEAWQLLARVNKQVNATIKAMSDQRHWGVPDQWDLPDDGYGDCEDYQLLKRKLLAEEGLPRRAMRMTVVIDDLNLGARGSDHQNGSWRLHPGQPNGCGASLARHSVYVHQAGRRRQRSLGVAQKRTIPHQDPLPNSSSAYSGDRSLDIRSRRYRSRSSNASCRSFSRSSGESTRGPEWPPLGP